MRRVLVVLAVILGAVGVAVAQPTEHGATSRGRHFGAPVVKYTALRDQGAVMFGGRGAWGLTPSLMLGFGVYGTMTEVDAGSGAAPDSSGPLDLKLETFGLDLEYAHHPEAPTHLTLAGHLGGAALHHVQDGTSEQLGETDFLWLLEPAVGLEQRVAAWCHLNLSVTYRLVGGVEKPNLNNGDIDGPALALAVKLGRF